MEASGFHYEVLHASPESGLAEFRARLRAERIDAVLIGGGVAGDSSLTGFKMQIIDVAHDEAPEAKVLEFDHSLEVPVLIKRAFGML